jgi:hypothetical protein
VVVIAGDDRELARALDGAARQRRPDVFQKWTRGGHRFAQRPVAQLEHVSQQHHALDVGDGLEQRRAQLGAAQEI